MSDPTLPLQQSLSVRDQFMRKRSLDSTPADRLAACPTKIGKQLSFRALIIGGHAVSFHGYVRGTEDAGILWDRTATSEESLVAALVELAAEYIGDEIDPATGIERTFSITTAFVNSKSLMMLTTCFGFLDLFDYVPGYPQLRVQKIYSI